MYCGRQLADGEKCSCVQSAAAKHNTHNSDETKTTYNPQEKKQKKYKSSRFRERWNNAYRTVQSQTKGQSVFKGFFSIIGQCLLDPAYISSNAGRLSVPIIVLLAAAQGLILSVIALLTAGVAGRGLIPMIKNILGFRGISGWRAVGAVAAGGIAGAFVYAGALALLSFLLYAIGKWIFRRAVTFWEIASAVAVCGIPIMIIGVFGIVFTIFSAPIMALLILCVFLFEFVMLCGAMQAVWGVTKSKSMYMTAAGLFFFLCVCYNIIRLFI